MDTEAWTALAIGHRAGSNDMPARLAERDTVARGRKPLDQFVFSGRFGQPAHFMSTRELRDCRPPNQRREDP